MGVINFILNGIWFIIQCLLLLGFISFWVHLFWATEKKGGNIDPGDPTDW
jgi:hypothetical protein